MIKNILTSLVVSLLVLFGFLTWNAYQSGTPHSGKLMLTPASRSAMTNEINNTIFPNGNGLITASSVNMLLQDFLSGVTAFMGDSPVVFPNPVQMNSTLTQGGAVISPPASGSTHFQWPIADGVNGQFLESDNPPVTKWATLANSPLSQKGYINGLFMQPVSGVSMNVLAGVAIDSTNQFVITVNIQFEKDLQDSPWQAGHGVPGLDTGVVTTNTWYHVYVIQNISNGNPEVIYSLSPTGPVMPTGYHGFRRIGSVKTDGSKNIVPFTQIGNEFLWNPTFQDVNDATLGATPKTYTLAHVPTGVNVTARFNAVESNATSQAVDVYSSVTGSAGANIINIGGIAGAGQMNIMVNTSAQIIALAANASTTFQVQVYGWNDQRGSQ